jgi:lysophospholipase L1-like esterase
MTAKPILTGILVDAPADAKAVVTFGDSITDGDGSKVDQTHRWPDFLAKRIVKEGLPLTVVNEGISGARILTDRMGTNSLARFDHDVIAQPRASTVILMMGINDIGWPQMVLDPNAKEPTAKEITDGYHQLIERAHAHGLRILGATLTPFEETFKGGPLEGYYNPDRRRFAWQSTTGSAPAASSMASSISTRSRATQRDPATSRPNTTAATTCIQTTLLMRRWRVR